MTFALPLEFSCTVRKCESFVCGMPSEAERAIPSLDFSVARDLRKRRGLTLEDISQRSGISVAVLSKLERNQTLAELETLHRLARAFGLSVSDLISLAESCQARTTSAERYRSGPFDFERIQFQGVHCFHATARAGDSLARPEAHGDEYEICWVLRGSVRITMTRETHLLRSGDALKFDAVLDHCYEVLEDAELVIVHLTKQHRF